MDFSYPPAAEAFRDELRRWLDEHFTDDYRDLNMVGVDDGDRLEKIRAWNRLLADARLAAIGWPTEYGGRNAGIMEQVVYAEEMHRAGAPGTVNIIGLSNIAPAIMQFGTEDQKRELLPRMLRGDDIWCQGFSEPNAGSDLASMQCKAVLDGDEYVINGQKTWNTLGHVANMCELLVRTDPEAPKHKGITCLLVDMNSPGIEVRPLVTITGDKEFNEIFFTDVRVPVRARLGGENDGWKVAMSTLAYERGSVANLHLMSRAKVRRLIDEAKKTPLGDGRVATDDPVLREKLARVYLEAELLKLVADRSLSGALHGREFGPESSVAKLHWSELDQHIGEVAGDVLGPDANRGSWGRDRVYMRSLTIAGGTTQINKNILATRVLGLPRA